MSMKSFGWNLELLMERLVLGAGVIGDISTPKERGGFFGMFNLGPMVSWISRCLTKTTPTYHVTTR